MTDADNVISLPLNLKRAPGEVFRDRGACPHVELSIDRATRKVICTTCLVELDPIDCLWTVAWRGKADPQWRARWQREQEEAVEQLEDLKKRLAKARAELRSVKWESEIEQFKASILEKIAASVDTALASSDPRGHDDGRHERHLIEVLEGCRYVSRALLAGEALERFEWKLQAGLEELRARLKRKSIRIVPKKYQRKSR